MTEKTNNNNNQEIINYDETIHVFGNSHAALFTGAPPSGNLVPKAKEKPKGRGYTDKHPTLPFRTWYLGPTLAYTFYEKHLPKIKSHISENKQWFPKGAKILLMVGEIDCRLAIPKQAKLRPDASNKQLVNEVVDRFFKTGIEIKKMGYEPIFFGMCPTTDPDYWFNPNTPGHHDISADVKQNWFKYGTKNQRNNFSIIWNNYMSEKCDKHKFTFISIYDKIVDQNNEAKNEYFVDSIHLKHDTCIDFIVEEFKNKNIVIKSRGS
jgi:hypothetical protein